MTDRSTHNVYRISGGIRYEETPCFCASDRTHAVGDERPEQQQDATTRSGAHDGLLPWWDRCARCGNLLVWSRAGESWCEVCCDDGEDYAEGDATCPHCGNYRPHGCLCRIPIPERYTNEDMARAWDEGTAEGDLPNPYRPQAASCRCGEAAAMNGGGPGLIDEQPGTAPNPQPPRRQP
jgi:hypothetical protein